MANINNNPISSYLLLLCAGALTINISTPTRNIFPVNSRIGLAGQRLSRRRVYRDKQFCAKVVYPNKQSFFCKKQRHGALIRKTCRMATTILFLAMPLVLASPISFLIMLGYIPVIAKRIKNEEKVLEDGLEGYAEYKKKVKYRILPFIW